ncbi:MAG: sugar nucleotide-binding protein, partial [Bacteroidetes bacterium]|nr:sugar nucleotide-binding protein [Bacteroidota bacterium]
MNRSFLILGANGQLGRQFTKELQRRGVTVTAPEEQECDITSVDSLAAVMDAVTPSVVVNCAAYNAVDLAEQQQETAFRINATAVGTIARICADRRMTLVHYSSDYVFDGAKGDRYTESDTPNPLNVYGQSKLSGEQEVLGSGVQALVFRTSWVFGNGQQNFIHKMLQWSRTNPVLRLTADEVSVPTSTTDLVQYTFY